jgi:hypothetical protein
MHTFQSTNLKGRDLLGDVEVDGRIIKYKGKVVPVLN